VLLSYSTGAVAVLYPPLADRAWAKAKVGAVFTREEEK
jgi:hypothetical protein